MVGASVGSIGVKIEYRSVIPLKKGLQTVGNERSVHIISKKKKYVEGPALRCNAGCIIKNIDIFWQANMATNQQCDALHGFRAKRKILILTKLDIRRKCTL